MRFIRTRARSHIKMKRRKRKTKPYGDQGKGIAFGFGFGDQDTIEGVITFRIDSRTIKRAILWLSGYRVPLGVVLLFMCMHLKPSELT